MILSTIIFLHYVLLCVTLSLYYYFPSLSVAHLDILASMPYKGTIQLAGAIACGIWEGIILPEGSKGLAEVLHLRIHGGDVKEDKSSSNNNKNGLLTLIKMVYSSKGYCTYHVRLHTIGNSAIIFKCLTYFENIDSVLIDR